MEYFEYLNKTKLFNMASEFECQAMMFCFKTRFKTFLKNEDIIRQGDPMDEVVLILKGSAIVKNVDSLGDISVLRQMTRGDVYGIESAYNTDEYYKDSVVASEKTLVMFMNKHRLITPCGNKCKRHEIVSRHLVQMLAENNLELSEKLTHMSKKTIRDKLMSYLTTMANRENSTYFEIPYNKTELANYLSVDRSAMSTELSKMKAEKIIDFDKNRYHLIKKDY
ncbi:MAG: Crp/Fnr family transcriptional regulator [Clostridia bacterium]|nr:Crp/Fnr family transcriptional regulator [Clostridia bacterium]